jgi:hypothetical protein
MNETEKALIIGAIDEILTDRFDHYDHFTDEQRERMTAFVSEVFDTSTPRDLREGLIALSTKLYAEVFGE